jgi:hypothetical protein
MTYNKFGLSFAHVLSSKKNNKCRWSVLIEKPQKSNTATPPPKKKRTVEGMFLCKTQKITGV